MSEEEKAEASSNNSATGKTWVDLLIWFGKQFLGVAAVLLVIILIVVLVALFRGWAINWGGSNFSIVPPKPPSFSNDSPIIGEIRALAGNHLPEDWLECDGQELRASEFPELSRRLSDTWGTSKSGFFNLPDLRGRFLRGWDHGAGTDSEASSRKQNKCLSQ